jgi:hypothetical protein
MYYGVNETKLKPASYSFEAAFKMLTYKVGRESALFNLNYSFRDTVSYIICLCRSLSSLQAPANRK